MNIADPKIKISLNFFSILNLSLKYKNIPNPIVVQPIVLRFLKISTKSNLINIKPSIKTGKMLLKLKEFF